MAIDKNEWRAYIEAHVRKLSADRASQLDQLVKTLLEAGLTIEEAVQRFELVEQRQDDMTTRYWIQPRECTKEQEA